MVIRALGLLQAGLIGTVGGMSITLLVFLVLYHCPHPYIAAVVAVFTLIRYHYWGCDTRRTVSEVLVAFSATTVWAYGFTILYAPL